MKLSEADLIKQLEQEGFQDLGVCRIYKGFDLPEHTHDLHTVHIVLEGELTVVDAHGKKHYKSGDRVEFPSGTTHQAFGGDHDGKMIVGFKP
jgi:quercetin dioxygenase-like cupin family protein